MANAKLVNFVCSRFSKKPMALHRKRTFMDLQLGWLPDVRVSPLQKRSLPVTSARTYSFVGVRLICMTQ